MRLGFHRLDFEYLLAPFYIASEVPEGSIWLCICLTAYTEVCCIVIIHLIASTY